MYDKDGNIIGEDYVAKGLKAIMEYHTSRLKKKLDLFHALASIEAGKNHKEADKESEIEVS